MANNKERRNRRRRTSEAGILTSGVTLVLNVFLDENDFDSTLSRLFGPEIALRATEEN